MTKNKTSKKIGLTPQNIAYIKEEFMKLPAEVRRKVLLIANALDEETDDNELIHSTVWYFSQKKNQKELEKVFVQFSNDGFYRGDLREKDGKGSIPRKVKILYPEA